MILKKPLYEEVNKIDLSPVYPLFRFFPEVLHGDINYLDRYAGQEHYKLLGWFAYQFNNTTLYEIGTCDGMGLLSMSINKNNKVISYDIMDYPNKHNIPINGERRLCDKNFNHYDDIINNTFIFYDANHNGKSENQFLNNLLELRWHGIIMYDDIYFNNEMKEFWNNISVYKEDWTDIGHECGTGIIFI